MSAKYVAPVIMAVEKVFNTMLELPVVAGKRSIKKEKRFTTDVNCLISMSGSISGFICLGLPNKLAILLTTKLLECRVVDANNDCIDAVGEITNMIAGNAMSEFPDDGISISVPKVILGTAKEPYPSTTPVISIPFETQGDSFLIDIGIGYKSNSR